jgi:sigma-B regulation protein RsbU (phosphoserine phosphatase)
MDSLLNYAPCGFLSFRDDGIIISVNHTLKEILGYQEDRLEGRNIESILTVASRIFYNTHFFPLIRLHSKADEIFFSLLGKDKKDIPVLTNAVRKLIGGVHENQCVFIPIHQRKRFEEEILAARKLAEETLKKNQSLISLTEKLETHSLELDKQLSKLEAINQDLVQLNRVISHDLQEPIRKIQIFTDILSRNTEVSANPKNKKALTTIRNSSDRLRQLISVLEHYVSIDINKDIVEVDLNRILHSAKEKAVSQKQFNDFNFFNEVLPVVEGYPEQLELLFYHLISNAIDYREPSRKLTLHVTSVVMQENVFRSIKNRYKYTDHVKITLADNGIGFDNDYKNYVFDLLKKLDSHTKGIGLGLPLSKKIVDNHSGVINVQSETGQGTEFNILLPLKMN